MPKSCEAVGCKNSNYKLNKDVSFHRFPKSSADRERRDRWIQAVKKSKRDGSRWSPGKHAVLCGAHFISGKPSSPWNRTHPDWVPTFFKHRPKETVLKGKSKLERYLRAKRIMCRRKLFSSDENCDTPVVPKVRDSKLRDMVTPFKQVKALDRSSINSPPVCTSCKDLQGEIDKLKTKVQQLQDENTFLQQERDDLQKSVEQLKCSKLSSSSIKENNSRSKFFTGLPWSTFLSTFLFQSTFVRNTTKGMSLVDQFFITLIKLRFNLPFEFIAYQTGFGDTTIREYFWKWIDIMYAKLNFLVKMPDPDAIRETLPNDFKVKYPRLTMLIDCFEVFLEQPHNFHARAQTYSTYKSHNTIKVFLACSPLGAITFISSAWGGRVSDVKLVQNSGFFAPGNMHLEIRF
ncbi:uncharacterized protein [Ptychodera flava]|uniref:uncharacterized protein n=1 Tax=Ptychodera flava TaxID=63121 RepID=UPI00396A1DCE